MYSSGMRKQLSIALAKHINQMLTKDAALEIIKELCDRVDATIDVTQFGSAEYGGYRFQCELMRDILPQLHVLHELQYKEVELEKACLAFNPDYGRLLDVEAAGGLLQFTARVIETGQLVGNMRVYLSMSTHTQTLICSEDTFYLLPEHRGGFLAVRLWQFVEKCCIQFGAREIQFDSKLMNNAGAMARYLKYTPVATKFLKVIDHV
jgi:GNAT superfamily N-acetyltransferase